MGRGNRGQKIQEFQSERYGGATELEVLQGSNPMFEAEEPNIAPVVEEPQVQPNFANLIQDAYRSTERPLEPVNARLSNTDAPFLAADAEMILQAMYRVLPSKEIAALLRNL